MLEKYSFRNNSLFYKTLLSLAIPMGLTNLFSSLLNMVDTLMISSYGNDPAVSVAAVASANKLFFLMNVTLYGVFTGCGVFVSQYWGKKDMKHLHTVYMTALFIGITVSTVFTLAAFFLPKEVIGFFSRDHLVVDAGAEYLRYVSFSYIISALLFGFEMVSRSTENVRLPMVISIAGVLLNTGLNYLFIFGHLGIPEMGIKGAAIATLLARIIQMLMYLSYILYTKDQVLFIRISNFVFETKLFKKMAYRVIPVVFNESLWAMGTTLIFKAYGIRGTDALSSMQLFDTFVSLLTVFTWGVANSAGIMIGKKYGEKQIDEAKRYAKLFLFTAAVFGVFTGIIIIMSIPTVPYIFFKQSSRVITDMQYLLLVFGLYMPIKLLAATFVVGILRSGGDTIFSLFADVGTVWVYAVPMSFIIAVFTTIPLPLLYAIMAIEEAIKDVICYFRYKSGKYIHNLVH